MSFLQLVRREMEGSLGRLVFVSAMAVVGGIVVALVVMALHRYLFGVRVVPFGF